MFAINSISPAFQSKSPVSCGKFAEQKAKSLLEIANKTVKETEAPQLSNIVLPNITLSENIAECVIKQAPKEYAVTSQKLAEQKGMRLFQNI